MRLSVTIDSQLLDEVKRLAQTKTKQAAIEKALLEFVQRHKIEQLKQLAGSNLVSMDLDTPPQTSWYETALLSESVLAEDWEKPQEDMAWVHLQQVQ